MLNRLRKPGDDQLRPFAPVADLSVLARGESQLASGASLASILQTGGELAGDEWAARVVRQRRGVTLRSGMLMKHDLWKRRGGAEAMDGGVRGAANFRQMGSEQIYALAQPTVEGITGVVDAVKEHGRPMFICLREEPLIYINSVPYVLRDDSYALRRNLETYQQISASRLELLEDRLRSDVVAELKQFDGRILVHKERDDGVVVPVWEAVQPENVLTLRSAMSSVKIPFDYHRVPMTAEREPDAADALDLVVLASRTPDGPLLVNCQLGRGRSTLASVALTVVRRWLRAGGKKRWLGNYAGESKRISYQIINVRAHLELELTTQNLLRVVRNGKEVKAAVDTAITECSSLTDMVDAIEDARVAAEDATADDERDQAVARGLGALRRYWWLLVLAAWTNETEAGSEADMRSDRSFKAFVSARPVLKTLFAEFDQAGLDALTPLEPSVAGVPGNVATDEVDAVVSNRSGRILSANTMVRLRTAACADHRSSSRTCSAACRSCRCRTASRAHRITARCRCH